MRALRLLATTVLWLSASAGVFLAFAWPFAVSADPAGVAFRVAATATLVTFLLGLAAAVAFEAARPPGSAKEYG